MPNSMAAMRCGRLTLLAAAPLAVALVMTACGSSTKTVSVGGEPPGQSTSSTATQTTSARTAAQPTGSTATQRTSGAPSPTRTASEPAFAEGEAKSDSISAAEATVRARGYTPTNTSDYRGRQALRVLIGVRTGSGDGYGQRAFFFVNGRYIGTDASQPSASLRVVGQSDTEITLAYPLYRHGDPLCCPGAGHGQVRFQLDNGKLTALDSIPPAAVRQGG